MKLTKSNGQEIDIELDQWVYTIEQQTLGTVQVTGILIDVDGPQLVVKNRSRRYQISIDDIFLSEDEANIICLKKQIATLKDNINASQRKLNKKLEELKLLER